MRWFVLAVASGALIGCYHGAPAQRDVSASWVGRPYAELTDRWGAPTAAQGNIAGWSYTTTHLELPSISGEAHVTPTSFDVNGAATPGLIDRQRHDAIATLDPQQTVVAMTGESLHWGTPRDANLRWGLVFGGHVGVSYSSYGGILPAAGGAYIGGMVSPRLGLVGSFDLAGGKSLAMAAGLGAQYWLTWQLSVRAGGGAVLAWDESFDDHVWQPAVIGAASYALVRGRAFVLDLRLDGYATRDIVAATFGVGVNIN